MLQANALTTSQLLDELRRRFALNANSRNVEELERLENEILALGQRLQVSEQGKSYFLSNVRNEINNPLTSIIGLAAAIHGITSEEKVKRMTALIQKQATELDFQLRNIIVAAEIEMGEVKPVFSKVNVVSLISNLITYFQEKIESKKAIVKVSIPCELKFQTDPYILQTICSNLFSNAIEFCGNNKIVAIDAEITGSALTIFVRDFGGGIDQEKQKIMFDRFAQGEWGIRKRFSGHGLGLSIVNELISLLNGEIEFVSNDQGTLFKVIIPETAETGSGISQFGNDVLFSKEEVL